MIDNTEVYCRWLHKVFRNIDDNIYVLHLVDSKEKFVLLNKREREKFVRKQFFSALGGLSDNDCF